MLKQDVRLSLGKKTFNIEVFNLVKANPLAYLKHFSRDHITYPIERELEICGVSKRNCEIRLGGKILK